MQLSAYRYIFKPWIGIKYIQIEQVHLIFATGESRQGFTLKQLCFNHINREDSIRVFKKE